MNATAQTLSVVPSDQPLPAPMTALTPMAMLSQAIERGMAPETIDKMMGLAERWEANHARKAFDEAIAAAKAEIKPILKTQKGHTGKYEDLAAIATEVDPILSKHGLSYRYRSRQDEKVHVTCVLSHKAGHSEETPLSAKPDTGPGRNEIQALGSAITYLQRYSLKLALGLSATKDDDGRAAGIVGDTITQKQADEIRELLDEVGGNRQVFLKYFKVESVEQIPAREYERVIASLNAKRTPQ